MAKPKRCCKCKCAAVLVTYDSWGTLEPFCVKHSPVTPIFSKDIPEPDRTATIHDIAPKAPASPATTPEAHKPSDTPAAPVAPVTEPAGAPEAPIEAPRIAAPTVEPTKEPP